MSTTSMERKGLLSTFLSPVLVGTRRLMQGNDPFTKLIPPAVGSYSAGNPQMSTGIQAPTSVPAGDNAQLSNGSQPPEDDGNNKVNF